MAQFISLGGHGPMGVPISSNNQNEICRLKKVIAPHHHIENGNIYGMNKIDALYDDPAFDKTAWPDMPNATAMVPHTKDTIVNHYRNLMESQMAAYLANAIEKGYMKSYEHVTKQTPLFDISKMFYSDELEKYSDPEINLYEDEVEHLRNYGWNAFVPCLNRFTIRINRQRYLYIEVVARNTEKKLLTLHIEDYAGSKFNWIKENEASFQLQFKNTNQKTGELPMRDSNLNVEPYDDFLTCHLKDMNWNKKQLTLWYNVLGVAPLDQSILVKMSPTKSFLEAEHIPDSAKQEMRFLLYDRNDISTLRTIHGMTPEIEFEDTKTIKAICGAQAYNYLKISYMKAITAINLELTCDPQAETKLSDTDLNKCMVGKMPVTAKGPLPIQMPKLGR